MDNDFFNFFNEFIQVDTKTEIINKYINGLITKEEYIRRMDEYNRRK
jgi:hypothetical protein